MNKRKRVIKFDRRYNHNFATSSLANGNTVYFTSVTGGSDENRTIIVKGEEYGREIPVEYHKLPYSEDVDGVMGRKAIVQREFMYDKFYVVDDDDDLIKCMGDTGETIDIANEWQQFSYSMFMPEYSYGLSVNQYKYDSGTNSGGGQNQIHPTQVANPHDSNNTLRNYSGDLCIGYGSWVSDSNFVITNNKNTSDHCGYVSSKLENKFTVQSCLGTNIGKVTGHQGGLVLVNDENATPKYVVDENGTKYYRNTRYDLDYANGKTDATSNTCWCAWVNEDLLNNKAYIIYGYLDQDSAHDVKGNQIKYDSTAYYSDKYPVIASTCDVYIAYLIDTKAHRQTTVKYGTTKITENHEASGYIVLLTIYQMNESNTFQLYKSYTTDGSSDQHTKESVIIYTDVLSLEQETKTLPNGNKVYKDNLCGIIPVTYGTKNEYAASSFDISRRCFICNVHSTDATTYSTRTNTSLYGDMFSLYNTNLWTNSIDSSETGSGYVDRNGTNAIRSDLTFNNGVLTIKFSEPNGYKNTAGKFNELTKTEDLKTNLPLNGSEIKIDFKTRTCEYKARTGYSGTVPSTGTIDLTTLINGGEHDIDIYNPVTDSYDKKCVWDYFTEKCKVMYYAESYANPAFRCNKFLLEDRLILDVRKDKWDVWKYDLDSMTYVNRKTLYNETPADYFYGSHQSYNDLTEKLWYSKDGNTIYEIKTTAGSGSTILTEGDATSIDSLNRINVDIATAITQPTIYKVLTGDTLNKNFIKINPTQDALEVRGMDTDCEVVSDDIEINGGPLAPYFEQVYGTKVPSGLTIQQMLIDLLRKELWAKSVGLSRVFTSSIDVPKINYTPTTSSVPVGSKVTITSINPTDNKNTSQSLSLKTMDYGYMDSGGTKHKNVKTIDGTYTPTSADTRTMKVSSSKFLISGDTSCYEYSGITTTQNNSVSNLVLYVNYGNNKITAEMISGRTYTAYIGITEQTVKVLTSFGNTYKKDKTGVWEETFKCPNEWKIGGSEHTICPHSSQNTITISGYYPYFVGFVKIKLDNEDLVTSDLVFNSRHEIADTQDNCVYKDKPSQTYRKYTCENGDWSSIIAIPSTTEMVVQMFAKSGGPWASENGHKTIEMDFGSGLKKNYIVYYFYNKEAKGEPDESITVTINNK